MEKNMGFFEKTFRLKDHGTNVRTEIIAGFTTFMTMAYILIVNPITLEAAGMDFMKVFTATALSAVIGTLVMGLVANLPFALAPGMGLNAFFAYTVVIGMGKSFEFALTAVFLEGLVFLLLTFFNVREAIINSIPSNIKKAISVGIGLFIAFIGLANAGIIVQGATPVTLGEITSGPALLALIGLVIAGALLAHNVKGALFIAILATTLIGIPMGVTSLPTSLMSAPAAPYFFNFEWSQIFSLDMLIVLFVFLFVDMFDTVGTLVGVSTKAKMLTEDGKVPNAKKALFADAVGTTVGAIFGTSTVTTYVESAAGVAEGGRTGLTSVVTAGLFAVALLFSPLFIMIPSAATAPALILVGLFMMSPVKEIDFDDFTEAIPAFLTILMMPLTYSISDGIVFGMLSYVALKAITGKFKDIHILTWIIAFFFIIKLLV
ncbi:MAG: NCS2 family permease [Clostridiales bacterium]|jgi:AGZA family xanthine/uracil permease-like MFS transporter|nr:NCS2 family permease [Clostridiales bacterium]